MSETPNIYQFPDEDKATAVLFLASLQELIDRSQWCTEAVIAALWHCLFEGEWSKRANGETFYRLTGQPKVTNPTLRWLAAVSSRDFLATVLCWMTEDVQRTVTGRWQKHPQEKHELLAGLRRWQFELRELWATLQQRGWIRNDLILLKGAA